MAKTLTPTTVVYTPKRHATRITFDMPIGQPICMDVTYGYTAVDANGKPIEIPSPLPSKQTTVQQADIQAHPKFADVYTILHDFVHQIADDRGL